MYKSINELLYTEIYHQYISQFKMDDQLMADYYHQDIKVIKWYLKKAKRYYYDHLLR
jgi:hypothetical protein